MAVTSKQGSQPGTPPPPGPASGRARPGQRLNPLTRFLTLREGSIVVVTIVTFIYFSATVNNFLSGSNFKSLLPYFTYLAILAAGEVFVMTLGEIDLSIGALWLFTPFMYWEFTKAGVPLVLAIILALAVAAIVGAITGFFTAYVGIPSFVSSLAMLFFLDGLTLILSHSEQITTPGTSVVGADTFDKVLGAGTYSELIWAVGIVIVLQIVLVMTRWGTYTVATGGNRLGAAEAGVNTRMIIVRCFMLSAVTAGFSGILEAIRTSSMTPDPSGSNNDLLLAVAAVIIGGTLMTGGAGTVVGALIGALFLGILTDGLVVKGVSANYEDLYLGIAIIIAMVFNVVVQRVRRGSGRGA